MREPLELFTKLKEDWIQSTIETIDKALEDNWKPTETIEVIIKAPIRVAWVDFISEQYRALGWNFDYIFNTDFKTNKELIVFITDNPDLNLKYKK
jgi:hypothetical protein